MPNHVTTRCTVTGPEADLAAFRTKMIRTQTETEGEESTTITRFDFDALIPMPSCASAVVENGLAPDILAVLAGASHVHVIWEHLRGFDRGGHLGAWKGLFNYEEGEIQRRLEAAWPGCIKNARAMALCIGETGFKSWYDWSRANWGTKWNSYDYAEISAEPERFVFQFETAWAFPHPVFRKLALDFPSLTFDCIGFDEGWYFAVQGAATGERYAIENVKATDDLYEAVYGRKPEHEEDEETEGAA